LSPIFAAALTVLALVAGALLIPRISAPKGPGDEDLAATVREINRFFDNRHKELGISSAEPADELLAFRRLSLALRGSIPSLAEIRHFEEDSQPDRLAHWTEKLLDDPRFGAYFGRRLADAFIGNRQDDFPNYRYEHFVGWFSNQVQRGRPYDAIIHEAIAATGFPSSNPAGNFLTAEMVLDDDYPNRLAARTVRAVLGQRIDCAQCHDHPFDDWSQADFQGLAAFYGQAKITRFGVEDDRQRTLEVEDRQTLEKRVVEPRVPFEPAVLPDEGPRRERFGAWITDAQNRRFGRAIVNRVWALMFGKPYHHPVDDIPDPPPGQSDETAPLDILAADLQSHGYDLRRTIRVIAASRPFRMASTQPESTTAETADIHANEWAVFPVARLRPEQVLASLRQASSIQPLDADPNILEMARDFKELEAFLREYGQADGGEFDEQPATIPQTLLSMNGRFTRRRSDVNPMSGPGRIALFAASDENRLETCYLACLTRRPTPEEQDYFLAQFREAGVKEKRRIVEDLFWTLFNSPEFAWSH
jgi:hypothetical protein